MNSKFGKYGEMNTGFTGQDVRGFTRIVGNQIGIYHRVQQTGHEKD
jgi:argininosuccinate synthase